MNRCDPPFQRLSPGDQTRWYGKRRFLFVRFARFLAGFLVIFIIATVGLGFLFSHLFGGGAHAFRPVWLLGLGLVFLVPIVIGLGAMRVFSGFANPFARIMSAADTVAEGDLSVRVPEAGPGEFGRLARSFNRMVAELERSDQLRRNLTADVAHELRTPLHIIQGNLEGIQDGIYPPDPDHIALLLDETHQLIRLVDDLRTLSLAEAGQLPLEFRPVDAGSLVREVAASFSGSAEAAGVQLEGSEPNGDAPLSLMADEGRLNQVLANLVDNALRHTPAGGTVRLEARSVDSQVQITVSDTGAGIPPKDLPYIFDRFWRADHKRTGNSGLGLAIARRLVEAHGGAIRVDSRTGQGTTFTVEMPCDQPSPGDPGKPS